MYGSVSSLRRAGSWPVGPYGIPRGWSALLHSTPWLVECKYVIRVLWMNEGMSAFHSFYTNVRRGKQESQACWPSYRAHYASLPYFLCPRPPTKRLTVWPGVQEPLLQVLAYFIPWALWQSHSNLALVFFSVKCCDWSKSLV